MISTARLGRLVAVLLVLGAALFVLGAGLERGQHHDEPAATATDPSNEQTGHDQASEAVEGHAASSTRLQVEGDEKVVGLDVESPGLVALGVGLSLAFAAWAWTRPSRAAFTVVAAFAAAFAILDVAELFHQVDRSNTGLALLAAVVALVHLLTAVASAAAAVFAVPDAPPIAPLGLS